jgi:hypothetical protein
MPMIAQAPRITSQGHSSLSTLIRAKAYGVHAMSLVGLRMATELKQAKDNYT